MNKKLKFIPLFIFILTLLALAWINMGSHSESGYNSCGGGGFIPKSSLPSGPGIYNGICLGSPVTKTINGRYTGTDALDVEVAALGVLSLILYLALLFKNNKSKS